MIQQPANLWSYFPGSVLVYGSAAKAAAINLNRILEAKEGAVFRYTQQGGESRLRAVRELGLGRPIGWCRELDWRAARHFTTTLRAISRDRLRIVASYGSRMDETVTLQLGRNSLWRVAP